VSGASRRDHLLVERQHLASIVPSREADGDVVAAEGAVAYRILSNETQQQCDDHCINPEISPQWLPSIGDPLAEVFALVTTT